MLAERALVLLAELDRGEGVALARLAKRLDQRVSVLLRELAPLGEAAIGAQAGPDWLRLDVDAAGRWTAQLTPAGRDAAQQLPPPP